MQIDTTLILKNLKGEDLKDHDGQPATIGSVIETAVLGQVRGDEGLSSEDKVALFKIAQRVQQPIAEFSAKDITKIMERIGKAWPPLVVGRAKEILDPSPEDRPAAKANGVDHQAGAYNPYSAS